MGFKVRVWRVSENRYMNKAKNICERCQKRPSMGKICGPCNTLLRNRSPYKEAGLGNLKGSDRQIK